MEFNKPILLSLRAARVNANLTQREAARKIGIGRATLQNYETGKSWPRGKVISKIAEVYNLPYESIKFF